MIAVCVQNSIFTDLAHLFKIKLAFSVVKIEVCMVTGIVILASGRKWITLLKVQTAAGSTSWAVGRLGSSVGRAAGL